MVAKSELPRLSPAELSVMRVLWSSGKQSAREVHQRLADKYDWAYSTTRTHLERLVRKELVGKAPFHGLHLYRASISRPAGLARMVREFARQVLGSNPIPVVSLFAEGGALNATEIAELRQLLAEDADREER
jgi:predicted transcriptional regulator